MNKIQRILRSTLNHELSKNVYLEKIHSVVHKTILQTNLTV